MNQKFNDGLESAIEQTEYLNNMGDDFKEVVQPVSVAY